MTTGLTRVFSHQPSSHSAMSRSRSRAVRQPRLVARRGVLVNDALARHPVDERNRLSERRLGRRQIVAVDRHAHVLERAAQARTELTIVLAVLQTLSMRFERRLVRSHRFLTL